uniref:L1 transposable element RRM domain-containing protein n=1 Tax=Latimeria chalumnae TaxID=7897 RepID=M3XLK1_LATCH
MDLMSEIKGMKTMLQDLIQKLADDIQIIKQAVSTSQKSVSGLASRTDQSEARISSIEDNARNTTVTISKHNEKIGKLMDKVTDLESRRSNLRLFGVPEGSEETPRDMCNFVKDLLKDILPDLAATYQFELEHAHQLLQQRPKPGQRPRAVVVKFVAYKEKEIVLQHAKQVGSFHWCNEKIEIYQDLPFEIVQRRREFGSIRKTCREKGLKSGILFPGVAMDYHQERDTAFRGTLCRTGFHQCR